MATPINPTASKLPVETFVSLGKMTTPAIRAIIPSGTLMKKIHRQPMVSVIKPPSTGAITGATSAGQVKNAMASSKSLGSVPRITANRPTGTRSAPPRPCRTRAAMSRPKLGASAQTSDATVNTRSASRNTGRTPKRSDSQPAAGMPTAAATR